MHGQWRSFCQGRLAITVVAAIGMLATTPYAATASDPAATTQQLPAKNPLTDLQIFQSGYPRSFYFRISEAMAADLRYGYEEWDAAFSRLMGIQGKALGEEHPNRPVRNIDFFTRFKKAHPRQLVILHHSGRARGPWDDIGRYFDGHWLYYNGAKILSDVPAETGETEIAVSNPRLFRLDSGGRYKTPDDIGLCEMDAQGRPNWNRAEQVRLISIDPDRGVVRVKRDCYGTQPKRFESGKAYAAAHVWAPKARPDPNYHFRWYYNLSTTCPRDANGRTAGDVWAEELGERFLPGGQLAAFNGISLDVLLHHLSRPGETPPDEAEEPLSEDRYPDVDADGSPDLGVVDGVNVYGAGVVKFVEKLRAKMGDDKLILADGFRAGNQQAFGLVNGVESEGWPVMRDREIEDWSGGLNRFRFWSVNARPPVFNYINHKFTARDPERGVVIQSPETPFSTHRLVFAVGVLTDSAICYSYLPELEEGELVGIWDELKMGVANRLGYLGMPAGPAISLARRSRDLLHGKGLRPGPYLLKMLWEQELLAVPDGDWIRITGSTGSQNLKLRLENLPTDGPDLVVIFRAKADPLANMPPIVGRNMGVKRLGSPENPSEGWINGREFEYSYYFRDIQTDAATLEITIEGSEPLWFSSLEAFAAPDAMYRNFEHGIVLANPGLQPYTFDLARLSPGRSFRRLQGSSKQDPFTNDGSPVDGPVTLGPKDALFLVASPGTRGLSR